MSHLLRLPASYIAWHYLLAWQDLARLYTNFAWFLWNFFSIPLLSRTLFSPWKRLHESKDAGTGGLLGSLILNLLLLLIGVFARLLTIITGLASIVLLSVLFLAALVLWPLLPLAALFFVVNGAAGLASF